MKNEKCNLPHASNEFFFCSAHAFVRTFIGFARWKWWTLHDARCIRQFNHFTQTKMNFVFCLMPSDTARMWTIHLLHCIYWIVLFFVFYFSFFSFFVVCTESMIFLFVNICLHSSSVRWTRKNNLFSGNENKKPKTNAKHENTAEAKHLKPTHWIVFVGMEFNGQRWRFCYLLIYNVVFFGKA